MTDTIIRMKESKRKSKIIFKKNLNEYVIDMMDCGKTPKRFLHGAARVCGAREYVSCICVGDPPIFC